MLGVDPRRFGDYASKAYLAAKNEEAYASVFTIHYPDEERPGAAPAAPGPLSRPDEGARRRVRAEIRLRNAPISFAPPRHAAGGSLVLPPLALVRCGWGRNAPMSWRMSASRHDPLRQGAAFGTGRAGPFLNGSWAGNCLPGKTGRVGLCHSLSPGGGVHSEFTIQREADDTSLPRLGGGLPAARP